LKKQGFLLITVLLMVVLLLVLCFSFLRSQVGIYRAARSNLGKAVARQLALSGLEDVRLKLLKDSTFPPLNLNTTVFTYVENVRDETARQIGSYRITLRSDKMDQPFVMLYIQSEGRLGPPDAPTATHTISAMCDMSLQTRDATPVDNPAFRRLSQIRDLDWKY
jgi:hypothetical protein